MITYYDADLYTYRPLRGEVVVYAAKEEDGELFYAPFREEDGMFIRTAFPTGKMPMLLGKEDMRQVVEQLGARDFWVVQLNPPNEKEM